MAFYLSPLVAVNEIDLSTTIPAVSTNIAVIILRQTYKGPELKKTLITNEEQLIDFFGKPTSTAFCYQDLLSAAGYLKDGNKLYCTRAMPDDALFSGTKAVSGADATFTPFNSGNAYELSDFASKDPDQFAEDIDLSGTNPFYLIASSRGTWGNNIRVGVCDKTTYSQITSGAHSTWDTYATIKDVDSPLTTDRDFLIIVQECPQGKDTTQENNWLTVEVWNVSTDELEVDDSGIRRFAETIINAQSKYIRINLDPDQKNSDITISTGSWQYFAGGSNGGTLEDSVIELSLDLYDNPEEIDVNVLIDSNKSEEIKRYMISICETRKDCMAILDCPSTAVINNSGSETDDLVNWRLGLATPNLNENTSYAAVYGNWLEVYDKYTGKYRWVPPSGYVAGIYARTDNMTDPWFAPAGLNRALLTNVRRLAWNPKLGYRDILYKNGINPIVSFAGQGKVVYGQKTLLDKSSAFNRINVRRLFITLEKAIATAVKYFLFEPNDSLTRMLLINMIDPFLKDVKARRGIYSFMIVCDESNNTPERIDRNELWCDIYLQPTRAAEFIVLNFIATKTGASFTELAAARAAGLI